MPGEIRGMSNAEVLLLQDISTSALNANESIRSSISGRVNSFILALSFVALGEATVIAAMLSVVLGGRVPSWLSLEFLICSSITIMLLACSALLVFVLYRKELAILPFPEKPELPYLKPSMYEKRVVDFTDDELSLFKKRLELSGDEYANVPLLYRRWVFQKVKSLEQQLLSVKKVRKTLTWAVVLIALSSAAIAVPFVSICLVG